MPEQIANLPSSVSNVIQTGLLALDSTEALQPAMLWRDLFDKLRHTGRRGEGVTMTREGLITPGNKASVLRVAGQDPPLVTRGVEQFSYQLNPFGSGVDIHLPSSYVAQSNRFREDVKALLIHAGLSMGRVARDVLFAAYGGGNSFAAQLGSSSTSLQLQDATGFDTVMVNGSPVPVSSTNPGSLSIAGAAAVTYTACNLATNTLTLSAAQTWNQYDAVVRSDAPTVVRQNSRASQRTIVSSDTPSFATFRNAATALRNNNVPGIDGIPGGLYGCYIDADVENALFGDSEIRNAIQYQGITGIFAAGTIGVYAGIQFMRMPKTESVIVAQGGNIQTPIHRSIMFGQGVGIEAFTPEAEFEGEVAAGGIPAPVATMNHYKMPLDANAVMTLVLRAPIDKAGEILSASWLANADYAIPTDSKALGTSARVKRACIVETAGPA